MLNDVTGPSVESTDVSKVDEALLFEVEADVYWCLTKLLDNIQVHNSTHRQPRGLSFRISSIYADSLLLAPSHLSGMLLNVCLSIQPIYLYVWQAQDHYTAMQPGLQRMVLRLEELVQRIDGKHCVFGSVAADSVIFF